jgi:hypothetical protein
MLMPLLIANLVICDVLERAAEQSSAPDRAAESKFRTCFATHQESWEQETIGEPR